MVGQGPAGGSPEAGSDAAGWAGDRTGHAAVIAFLRQLALGLSAYTLFPGDLEQPTFLAAVERIRTAANRALATGPVRVIVHGSGLSTADGAPLDDPSTRRLALALFDRRVQRLEVRAAPEADDLGGFYAMIAASVGEVDAAGGPEASLRARGVTAIVARGLEPEPEEAPPLTDEQEGAWRELVDPHGLARQVLADLPQDDPSEAAISLFRRFAGVLAALPEEVADSPAVYGRFQRVLDQVPEEVRRAFTLVTVARVGSHDLAQGYLGTMTNAELARAIVDLGATGPHPLDLARRLVAAGTRHADVVDLTAALLLGAVPQPELDAASGVPTTVAASTATASELLARGAELARDEDVRAIQAQLAATPEEANELALAALHDYLRNERDRDRVDHVLDVWTVAVRDALREDRPTEVSRLLGTLPGPGSGASDELLRQLEGRVAGVLDVATVTSLTARGRADGFAGVATLVGPFGPAAVDRFFEVLADEPDAGVRAQLVTLIAELVRGGQAGHLEAVRRRLGEQRWHVVRNALTVLQRAGPLPGSAELVASAVGHQHPLVRREVVRASLAVAGTDAVGVLRTLVNDPETEVATAALQGLAALASDDAAAGLAHAALTARDQALGRRALDLLGTHPSARAPALLRELTTGEPRLPWRLRRVARSLARQRSGGR